MDVAEFLVTDPGVIHGLPEDTYHADPCPNGSLSYSGAKVILQAPALYRWQRDHPVFKNSWDEGSAAHAIVLGEGIDFIYVAPFDDWKTKAAQEEQRLARESGLSPVLPKFWETACAMAEALANHRLASMLLARGDAEVSAFAPDPATGVMRRGRADWVSPGVITDYKTAASADPGAFARAAASFGYHMQAAWYLDLWHDLGEPIERFAFIVQEKTPPYLVEVIELDEDALDLGRRRNALALQVYRDCRAAGLWPGYRRDDESTVVSLPRWAYYEGQE
jgi:hypothetical protein